MAVLGRGPVQTDRQTEFHTCALGAVQRGHVNRGAPDFVRAQDRGREMLWVGGRDMPAEVHKVPMKPLHDAVPHPRCSLSRLSRECAETCVLPGVHACVCWNLEVILTTS